MKKNRTCPKCQKTNIIGPHEQDEDCGIKVEIGGEFMDHKISSEVYVCLDCGYMETYLNNKELIRVKEYLRLKGEIQ